MAFQWTPNGCRVVTLCAFLAAIITLTNESYASGSDEALLHGRAGLAEYDSGHWQVALDEFSLADSLMHSPVFRLYVARCLLKLNRWVDAKKAYTRILEGPLDAGAPLPWRQASEKARSEIDALMDLLPSVVLVIRPATEEAEALELFIDNQRVDRALQSAPIDLSPGEHQFTARRDGETVASRRVVLRSGDKRLSIGLDVLPAHKVTGTGAADAPQPKIAHRALSETVPPSAPRNVGTLAHPFRTAGGVALGLGALGLAVGITAGLWAWHERDTLVDRCGGYHCPQQYQARWARAHRAAGVATAALVVSGVDLAVGTYLFYAGPTTGVSQSSGGGSLRAWSLGVVTVF